MERGRGVHSAARSPNLSLYAPPRVGPSTRMTTIMSLGLSAVR